MKMKLLGTLSVILFFVLITPSHEQRITTIQLDGVQYFVSRMNPYSPELNFFLAYQYCRSLGLQLVSFETREKADSITQYLSNAGFTKYDFWTSGNKLGTNMYLWMSSGLPFNSTFNYLKRPEDEASAALTDVVNSSTSPQRTARESGDSGSSNGCVALKAPTLEWATDDCTSIKDFICEQTRCYYYNYGSIPVSSAQGRPTYEKSPTKPSVLPSPPPSSSTSPPPPPPGSLNVADFMTRLRSSSTINEENVVGEDVKVIDAGGDVDHEDDVDTEESTNGPYDGVMRDDPHAHHDHDDDHEQFHDEHVEEDAYVSTIVPEYVTTLNPSMIH